jgi:hypothetical protein
MLTAGDGFKRTDCPRCNRGRELSGDPNYLCLHHDPLCTDEWRKEMGIEPLKENEDVDGKQ